MEGFRRYIGLCQHMSLLSHNEIAISCWSAHLTKNESWWFEVHIYKVIAAVLVAFMTLFAILNYGTFLSLWLTHHGTPYGENQMIPFLIMGVIIVALIFLIPESVDEKS